MGWFDFLKSKKETPILKQEDVLELQELQRQSYMAEARKLVVTRGQDNAKQDLTLQKPKKDDWTLNN